MSERLIPYQPVQPTPKQTENRLQATESRFWQTLAPTEIIDPQNSLLEAKRKLAEGFGIDVVVGPHPGLVDMVNLAHILFRLAPDKPLFVPIAVHWLKAFPAGVIVKKLTDYFEVQYDGVVTSRTTKTKGQKFTASEKSEMAQIMFSDMVSTLVNGGVAGEFIHGDRALNAEALPPKGILAAVQMQAKRLRQNNIAFLFGYLDYPKKNRKDGIKGVELRNPCKIYLGNVVTLQDAINQSRGIEFSGDLMPIDAWGHQQILEIAKRVHPKNP